METVIITSVTSLVVSMLSLFVALRNQRLQEHQFEKTRARGFTTRLYECRLAHYPGAFAATDGIQKQKSNELDPVKMQRVAEELEQWKTGMVSLILSRPTLACYYELADALSRAPACGQRYSREQVEKLWACRNRFRRSLKKDIGLLYCEE